MLTTFLKIFFRLKTFNNGASSIQNIGYSRDELNKENIKDGIKA